MKKLILILVASLMAGVAMAGSPKTGAVDSLRFEIIKKAVESKNFIVEADRASFNRGRSVNVSSVTNFISVKDESAVIQISTLPGSGMNGVGGITVEGSLSGYEIRTSKRGAMYITFDVMGPAVSANVTISLPKNGERVSVRINGNFNTSEIALNGTIMPTFESKVFQGTTIY